jgi:NADH-quinone oxidoreductase subunit E
MRANMAHGACQIANQDRSRLEGEAEGRAIRWRSLTWRGARGGCNFPAYRHAWHGFNKRGMALTNGDKRSALAYKCAARFAFQRIARRPMSIRRLDAQQPSDFAFSTENEAWAKATIAKYPPGKGASAVIPLLWRAQEQQGGWLPEPALRLVADMLGMAYIRVYEIATFYTMFQLSPVGKKAHVWVCGTTPCMLRGAEALVAVCKRRISEEPHRLSSDGNFSWEEVECLGVCANAPMVQIGKDTYEDLTPELLEKVLDGYAAGNPPPSGSQIGRQASCPAGGPTTLTDFAKAARK